ncbi:phenol 2-monooxygenase [Rhodotorula toruloides]|uniref:Phenol 2-monooxygenase n=1 Tax=Rhodotorula toruloides TaxID=5286 RepID=A0A511KR28_RHOTO|nr:phenol 2-monooxygenase [Rhodotorula toruloides]
MLTFSPRLLAFLPLSQHRSLPDRYHANVGQADGLNPRSLEIFESLGIIEQVEKEASPMARPHWQDARTASLLSLLSSSQLAPHSPDTNPGLSRFQQTILHQGRVEAHLIDDASKHSKGAIAPERSMLPETLSVEKSLVADYDSHPITLTVRHLSEGESTPDAYKFDDKGVRSSLFRSSLLSAAEEEILYKKDEKAGRVETVKARYLVGCDGAHSWTRRQLDVKMLGDQTNLVWGVLDLVPRTNFPDIRMACAIQSAHFGSIMVIPQPRDLVRLYIQLPIRVESGAYLDRSRITSDTILATARKILHPYTLDYESIDWFTGYHVGQRLTESFMRYNRIFLAGDACHTHSPKAGQGMNTSMQDTWNLCWKLGLVAIGIAKPELVETYSLERQPVAAALLSLDCKLAKSWSSKRHQLQNDTQEDKNAEQLGEVIAKGKAFTLGMSIKYADSIVVGKDGSRGAVASKQHLASKLPVGERFYSAQVVNQASATADQLTTRIPFTGAFRLLVFPGDIKKPEAMKRLQKLADYLDSPESVVSKYTPSDLPRWAIIDPVTIHCAERTEVELYDFPQPSIFHPHNYKRVYCDGPSYHRGDGKAYETYGISKEEGAIVVVRPDQYTGLVVGLEDTDLLDAYFAQFMQPAKDGGYPGGKVAKVLPPDWSKIAPTEVAKTLAIEEVHVNGTT